MAGVTYMKMNDIQLPENVRDGVADEQLINSIKQNGILVPLMVFAYNDKWFLKDGYRRYDAARCLNLDSVPCTEVNAPSENMAIEQLVINETRKGVPRSAQAEAYLELRNLGYSQRYIAQKVGVSDAEVSLALASLNVPQKIKDAVDSGKLSPSAVEPLLSMDYDTQVRLADAVIQAKTVRNVRALVHAEQVKNTVGERTSEQNKRTSRDPNGLVAIEALKQAVEYMEIASEIVVTDPELLDEGRVTVSTLLQMAQSIRSSLK